MGILNFRAPNQGRSNQIVFAVAADVRLVAIETLIVFAGVAGIGIEARAVSVLNGPKLSIRFFGTFIFPIPCAVWNFFI